MSKFDSLKLAAVKSLSPVNRFARQHAPALLTAAGVTGVVASGVLLVKQTLTVQPIIETHQKELVSIKSTELTPAFGENDRNRLVARRYADVSVRLAKHYAPAVTIGLVGLTCLLASHGILRKQNVALAAAYKAVEQNFMAYRERVAERFGEEEERNVYLGLREIEQENPETGEIEKVTVVDPNAASPYAKFFDEFSTKWSKTAEYNLIFLRNQQAYWNQYLQSRGYVFLNDVYEALGIPRTQAGNIVGWVRNGGGDNEIDFGIYDFHSPEARAFVNGHERSIRLDFNVDGPILDLIPKN